MKGKLLDETSALKIKEAAREIFISKGYDGATMQAIADLAGFNKAQLHYYFRNKDSLFLLIFKEEMQTFLQSGADMSPVEGSSVRDLLVAWVEDRSRLLSRFPQMPLFLLNEIQRNPEITQALIEEMKIFALPRQFLEFSSDFEKRNPGTRLEDLLTMVVSLLVFPLMGAPLIQVLLGITPERWPAIQARQVKLAKELLDKYLV